MNMDLRVLMMPMKNTLVLFKNGNYFGKVDSGEGEPEMLISGYGEIALTFLELEIILDNWNQLQEMIRTQV